MSIRLPLLVVFAVILAVPACGQKGPLVLPDAQHPHRKPKFPAQKPPAPPAAAPAPTSAPETAPPPSSSPETAPAPSPEPSTAPNPAPSTAPQI